VTDEPIEPISPPRPGTKPGSGHAAGMTMTGSAPTGNPFLAPRRSVPPEIRAIPARTPGFAPRQRSSSAEQAALRPAAGFEPPQQAPPQQAPPQQAPTQQASPQQAPPQQAAPPQQPPPVYQEPPVQELHWASFEPLESQPAPEFSRRRNNLVIGASAAAAVAVAIGAISLTHKSAPSTSASTGEKFSAAFGPGAGDPTQGPHNNGQPLDGSTSASVNQDSSTDQVSNTATTSPANAPPAIAAPPNPPQNPATPKPPPKPPAVCTGWHTTHIPAQDGKGNAAGASTLHAGPYATCATVGATFSSGQHMYIWCHAVNVYGATWVYGRMDSTSAPGWQAVTALKAGAKLGPVC
jgi:hypothetical protein